MEVFLNHAVPALLSPPVDSMSFAVEPISPHSVIVRVGTSLNFANAGAFKQACLDQVRGGTRQSAHLHVSAMIVGLWIGSIVPQSRR